MTRSILITLVIGVLVGLLIIPPELAAFNATLTRYALIALLFFVGIDIGTNKHIFNDLKKHGLYLLLVPLGIIIGSLAGGVLTGYLVGHSLNNSLAIGSGFGWYSLSGVLLTSLESAEIGTVAFLSNVFREVIAIVTIPYLAKHVSFNAAIAPAGATSMDTTLPIISQATSPETVLVSFTNGVILSFLVPILVPFFHAL
ncbi:MULTISPECIES: lysine exporter LysO family protein [unclassified Fusibacter]|uniref:lysine exporter LysO family protein n=1 Tax=unclassified Fusibacter TaxID=2624464 RepID=UPI0010131405|nr:MULTISPECIES: lysine exporter LysO family protein [unclassified Fusibacter]MCK8061370.1 lysine exporter LysO family protein [Fusibacter sp. A2]NPE23587.1 lysine exporter LysO family protein [Fusibacter sp. A1]RXV58996.1 lysine exporter LysO family protein [Fusibacter sp. A1]